MSDSKKFVYSHREIVEALIKHADLHEGLWQLYVEFGMAATNFGPDKEELLPTAVVAIKKVGLIPVEKETNLSADAAIVNPKQA